MANQEKWFVSKTFDELKAMFPDGLDMDLSLFSLRLPITLSTSQRAQIFKKDSTRADHIIAIIKLAAEHGIKIRVSSLH